MILSTDVMWVEGDLGEVSMEVYNPLPFELKVSQMVSSVVLLTVVPRIRTPAHFPYVLSLTGPSN